MLHVQQCLVELLNQSRAFTRGDANLLLVEVLADDLEIGLARVELLGGHQSEVSKIGHWKAIGVSTIVEYVAALGGRLEIRAVFPDHEVRISQFEVAER